MNINDKSDVNNNHNLNEYENSILENTTFYNMNIIEDSLSSIYLDNTFAAFKSIDYILLLIYSNKIKSIISYNLTLNNKINEIKNAHNYFIINIRHYFDSIKKIDLILTISYEENNLKIWDINFNSLVNLKNIN